jgi:hypothetical protein
MSLMEVMLTTLSLHNGSVPFAMRNVPKIGSLAAMAAFAAIVLYGIAQILQIVNALRPPLDGILLYGFSLCIVIPFVISMLALHYVASAETKFWSSAALIFTVMYGTYVTLNYVVQLATVIPAGLQHRLDEVRILDQTPHSLFWDVDALGYICMGFATLFGSFVFRKRGVDKWAKRFFLGNAVMTPVIALVYFYPTFSIPLLILGAPWLVTAAGSMFCLALYFKNAQLPQTDN